MTNQLSQESTPESAEEQQFVKKHRNLSAVSAGLFAIAGATFIGVLGKLASDLLSAAQKTGKLMDHMPKSGRYWGIVGGLAAFGAVCMFLSNWLESKKTVLEWRLGGNKISRKMQMAENAAPAEAPSAPLVGEHAPAHTKEEPAPETTQWRNKREGEKKELTMTGAGEGRHM